MQIKDIQKALKDLGFDPGEIDGVWGRRTIAAVKEFQKARGLVVDGVAGDQTIAVLMKAVGSSTGPTASNGGAPLVWLEEALTLVGTKEVQGDGSNPRILDWATDYNIDYKRDDIPWCGLFVAHCIGSTLPDEPLPSAPLLARSWQKFGEPCEPARGAVLVFWRGDKNGHQGHVGFYLGEDSEAYHVLGGNQSDMVNKCRIERNRLLQARWPRTAAAFHGEKLEAVASGALSHNEA